MTNVVQLRDFGIEHIPDARTVRVARLDCEVFEVTRRRTALAAEHPGSFFEYAVYNRTHFPPSGYRYARTLAEVRDIIRRA